MHLTSDMKRFLELNSDLIEEDHSALYYICPSKLCPELMSVFKLAGIDFKPSINYIADEYMLERYHKMRKLFS